MKFIKGMLIGGILSAGVAMMYADRLQPNRRKMIKKGKQLARKIGVI